MDHYAKLIKMRLSNRKSENKNILLYCKFSIRTYLLIDILKQ
jgi:hypothetical protein